MSSEEKEGMKNIYALGFVSFFTDVSTEMVLSILPAFVLSLPGGNPALLGLIEGVAEALSYALRAVSGFWSDLIKKRKLMVLIGYGISTLVKPLFSIASTTWDVLLIRVGDRVGKGIRTAPRDALISESVSGERSGTAFGLHRTMDQLGAIVGPLLASGLMIYLGLKIRDVFWISFIPGSIALIIILFFVTETVPKTGKFEFLKGLKQTLTSKFNSLLLVVGLFSLGAFNFSFVLLNAIQFGISDALIPVVYAIVNVTHTVIAIPAGMLSDKIGKEKVLTMGYGVFLISTILLFMAGGGVSVAYLIAAVYGVYMGIVETVQRAMVPKYAGESLRGTAYGIYYLVVGFAFLFSNAIVGWLWYSYGSSIAGLYSSATTVLAILGMLWFLRKNGD